MGLEAPLALLGLLATALPLIAHRLRRRDLTPIRFPPIALLRAAEAAKRRSRGLTDILLLCLRIAIIVVACLALTAPYVTARLSFGDGTVASAAIIVDDSMSMMRSQRAETLLQRAVARAQEAIGSLPTGSEVAVIASGKPARLLLQRSDDLLAAREALVQLATTSVRDDDMAGARLLAEQQLAGARHKQRRLLILSDFAAHTGIANVDLGLEGTSVSLERIGESPAPANVYFSSASATADPTTEGQMSISVELASTGNAPSSVPVSVHNAGREIARAELAMVDGRAREVIHVATASERGDPTALLRIEVDDALREDNQTGVLLRRTDSLSVMLVNGDPHPASARDELYYALSALRLSPLPLSLRTIDAATLRQHDLTRTDAVVLANVPAPAPAVAERLSGFVRSGGGLLVAAGHQVTARRYNATLGGILPARIRARVSGQPTGLREAAAGSDGLLPQPSGLQKVSVRQRLILEGGSAPPLEFEDGSPAVALRDVERGRSALLATSIDADWSDLPLHPGFLPLLSNLVSRIAQAQNLITSPVEAGQPVSVGVPPGATRMEIVTPEGVHHRFDATGGLTTVEFSHTELAGPYRVLAAGGQAALGDVPRGAFLVETPAGESDLTHAPEVEGDSRGQVGGETVAARVQRPVAPFLFLLCALLIISEGLLRLRAR